MEIRDLIIAALLAGTGALTFTCIVLLLVIRTLKTKVNILKADAVQQYQRIEELEEEIRDGD